MAERIFFNLINGRQIFQYAKESFWIIFGNVNTVFASFCLISILTQNLSPEDYGILALGLTFVSLVNQVVLAGIAQGFARFFVLAKKEGDLYNFFSESRRIILLASLVIILLGIIISISLFILSHDYWILFVISLTIYSLFSGWSQAINSIQNSARQRSLVAFHTGFESWLKTGLIFLFFNYQLKKDVGFIISVYTLSLGVVLVSQLYFLKNVILSKNNITVELSSNVWTKRIWDFSRPFSVWGFFTWLQLASDRWALQTFTSSNEVGKYAVLYQIGYAPVALITGFVVTLVLPMLYERVGDIKEGTQTNSAYLFNKRLTIVSIILTVVGFLLLTVFHRYFLKFFVSNEYLDVSYLLPWIFLAGGIFSSGQIISLNQLTNLRTNELTNIKILTAVLGIIFSVIGAKFFGLVGVVIGLLLFSIVYFLGILKLTHFSVKKL
jgi:O-antigen/teichoic acid export membrane protein